MTDPIRRSKRMFGNLYTVECKCPLCECIHLEYYPAQPIVMPRRACPDCKPLFRAGENEINVRGLSLRNNQSQKNRRAMR